MVKSIIDFDVFLCIQWFVEVILRDFFDIYYLYEYSPIILGLLTLILAYNAFFQKDLKEVNFRKVKEEIKPEKFIANEKTMDIILSRMRIDKDYLEPKLSLKEFSSRCKLPQKTVSQYLNQGLKKSFHDFINGYRIEEFKEKVNKSEGKNLTLEGVAYECGFNSKPTFNRIFKKNTGITPSEYVSKQG